MPEAPAALREFEQACAALVDSWAGALTRSSSSAEADVQAMSDTGLVRVVESLGALARRVESLQARSATAVAARSRGIDPDADLARKHGFASAERLLCDAFGSRYTDAARLVAVGDATSQRSTITGQALPARHPHVAAALDSGAIGVDAAELIRRFLDRVAVRAERDTVDEAEQFLVARAPAVGVDGIPRLTKHLEAQLDPDGVRPSEDEQRARRALTIWEDASGMINLRGAFDPATGAPIKLAIETLVGAELHRARDAKHAFVQCSGDGSGESEGGSEGDSPTDPVLAEERTITQLNADIARLSLTSADAPPALRGAVVVARIDLESLTNVTGHATIDGIDQPVSAATARELAASAGIIPMVLGGRGKRSTSDARRGSSLPHRSSPSSSATAVARGPDATALRRTRRHTTSDGGSGIAVRPTSRMASCSAVIITIECTTTAGASRFEITAPGSRRRSISIPSSARAPATAPCDLSR